MDEVPLSVLLLTLLLLILLSAFFSGSETGLMTLNRYRLRHLADKQHRGAIRAEALLQRQDRLIGLILLGNNFVNVLASILMTLITLRLYNDVGLVFAGGMLLTVIILLFAEVAPKTLAALHPERIAFPAAWVYVPLMKLLYPLVWLVNAAANIVLKLFGVSPGDQASHALTNEELRTVVMEAGALIPKRHQSMLLNLMDLEKVTVEDIMVPRNEITGIDLDDDWETRPGPSPPASTPDCRCTGKTSITWLASCTCVTYCHCSTGTNSTRIRCSRLHANPISFPKTPRSTINC